MNEKLRAIDNLPVWNCGKTLKNVDKNFTASNLCFFIKCGWVTITNVSCNLPIWRKLVAKPLKMPAKSFVLNAKLMDCFLYIKYYLY